VCALGGKEETRVGWQEEPHLRGVLVVGVRRSANTHGDANCSPVFSVRMFSRNVSFRMYLGNQVVHIMSETFRMCLVHLDNNCSCIGTARARNVALFRMHLL
jgi:hypothetical protein